MVGTHELPVPIVNIKIISVYIINFDQTSKIVMNLVGFT